MEAEGRRPRVRTKTRTVAFKADAELVAFLRRLPNTSDFIRKALLARFGMTCPLCAGAGVVARGVGEHYAGPIAEHRFYACAACGAAEPIPADPDAVPDSDRARWEQFLHGGSFFCPGCYGNVEPPDALTAREPSGRSPETNSGGSDDRPTGS